MASTSNSRLFLPDEPLVAQGQEAAEMIDLYKFERSENHVVDRT